MKMAVAGREMFDTVPDAEPRLSICYVAPGQYLLPSAGPTRNVLNLAIALSAYADVTVAFRRRHDQSAQHGVDVLEIDGSRGGPVQGVADDAAVRGISVADFAGYAMRVRRFTRDELPRFDLVFEKSWTLSGLVAAECKKIGVPAVVVENLVPVVGAAAAASLAKRIRIRAGKAVAGRLLRRADRIIAETPVLKSAMAEHWHIDEQRISVVALGVDRERFRPLDQAKARSQVGIPEDKLVMLYSGVLDATHDLRPVVSAMARTEHDNAELHIIGDGVLRPDLEQLAGKSRAKILFHGRVPYEEVPTYIAAADLCLAPYEPAAFPGGQIAYSSLKIPEYMSVGRPVVSVPSGRVLELVDDGRTGFLFANEEHNWRQFLQALPGRDRLAQMGSAAMESGLDSWDDVARAYLEIGKSEISRARRHAH